jgi:putative oxidoreductase
MKDLGLLLLRVLTGGIMIYGHGFPKLLKLYNGAEIKFSDLLGIGAGLNFGLAVFAEFICSSLLILGLFTRLSLIPLTITMFVAGFIHHAPDPCAVKEKVFLYLIIFVAMIFTGGGKYALNKILPAKYQKL